MNAMMLLGLMTAFLAEIICSAIVVLIVASVIAVNVSEHRRRSRLTPEQRKAEDAEADFEMQIW